MGSQIVTKDECTCEKGWEGVNKLPRRIRDTGMVGRMGTAGCHGGLEWTE